MYVATVLLKRSERQFWRMSPRKLNALVKAHIQINNPESNDPSTTKAPSGQGFIDQIF